MAWSYRRRVKLIPGVYLNFSRSGISTSIGIKGAHITVGTQGTYLNLGIPGTGIYNRGKISPSNTNPIENIKTITSTINKELENSIISVEVENITSQDMQGIKNAIITANKQREELSKDIQKIKHILLFTHIKLYVSYIFIVGLIIKKIAKNLLVDIKTQKESIIELQKHSDNSYVKLEIGFDDELKKKYDRLIESFKNLMTSHRIWDVVREVYQDRRITRSAASKLEDKKQVRFELKSLPDIRSESSALFMKNAIGPDLYVYPNFIVMYGKNGNFGLIEFKELDFQMSSVRFVETDTVPIDSKIIDRTWLKVNKDGSPDRRFKENRQIPIVQYGQITMKTASGMNEEFEFSNYEACMQFATNFNEFKSIVTSLPNLPISTI